MLFTPSTRKNYGYDLFDDFFNDSFFTAPAARTTSDLMRTDVKDDGTNYLMEMELPGFKKEEISISLEDGNLTIQAAKGLDEDEKEKKTGRYIRRERYAGSCARSFYVGDDITEEDIKAEFKHGILKIFVPKKEAKPEVEQKKYIAIEG